MPAFVHSLKFQIGTALTTLVFIFLAFSLYALSVLEKQRVQGSLLRLAASMLTTTQDMAIQAVAYGENAPRDYPTYFRDLKLYYQDLKADTENFGKICHAFAAGDFEGLFEENEISLIELLPDTKKSAQNLEYFWTGYVNGLNEQLGTNIEGPRLEYASAHVTKNDKLLSEKTRQLSLSLQQDIDKQTQRTNHLFKLTLLLTLVIAAGIMLWFYRQVLTPLSRSVGAFDRVAQGDFGYNVNISTNNEIGWLSSSFNLLSTRLDKLFKLTTKLQEGSDLDDTLKFVANSFPELLPLNWVGILFVNEGNQMQLEKAYHDGHVEPLGHLRFPLQGTLLEQCFNNDEPLHIPDTSETALLDPSYKFVQFLVERGQRDAIFLPVTKQSPIPGVLVFATRNAHSYTAEHLALMSNLATVITLSFGRTLKLAEHAQLAAIGQFASGIAHEIRSPLATVNLALDYLKSSDLPVASHKRLTLASHEVNRIGHLLEDMLLYAKPLKLNNTKIDVIDIINKVLESLETHLAAHNQRIPVVNHADTTLVFADGDRLLQVFINLINNAMDADHGQDSIYIELTSTPDALLINVHNQGEVISPADINQIFEAFFTTKSHGTGLGLPIIRRIISAHGGEIEVSSNQAEGTCFTVRLPLFSSARPVK